MIEVKNLFNFFKKNKINYFTGVPDSVLKATNEFFKNKSEILEKLKVLLCAVFLLVLIPDS